MKTVNDTTKYNVTDSKSNQKRTVTVSSESVVIDSTEYQVESVVGNEYKIRFNISDTNYAEVVTKIVVDSNTVVLKNICNDVIAEYVIIPDSGYLGPHWIMYQVMQKNNDGNWVGTEHNITFNKPLFAMTKKDIFMFCVSTDGDGCTDITDMSKTTDKVAIKYSYTSLRDKTIKTGFIEIKLDEKRMPILVVRNNAMFPVTRFR